MPHFYYKIEPQDARVQLSQHNKYRGNFKGFCPGTFIVKSVLFLCKHLLKLRLLMFSDFKRHAMDVRRI